MEITTFYTMKETKKMVILGSVLSILLLTILYLFGAFITWDINPNNWDIGMRMFWAIFGIAAIAFSFLVIQDIR